MLKMKLFIFFISVLHLAYCQEPTYTNTDITNENTEITATDEFYEDTTITEIISEDTTYSEFEDTTVTYIPPEDITATSNFPEDTTSSEITTVKPTTEQITTNDIITTTEIITSPGIPILYLTDINHELSWSPKFTGSLIIEAAEGYKISVNITDCNLDGGNGDYVTITTDQYTNGLIFTYGVSRKPSYLYNSNRLFGEFVGTEASNFTVLFSLVGEALISSTTETPTTAIILPTPSDTDSSALLVHVAGRNINDYLDSDVLYSLKYSIGAMAAKYCQNENFPLNGSITSDNAIINYIVPCSRGWPNSETCVQLNFSVPVNLVENAGSLWTGYQMTTAHLRIMWDRYASTYLRNGTTIYSPPGNGNFKWGVVFLLIGTFVFAFMLLAIRHYGMRVSKLMRRRKLSDTASIISASDRNSQISLPPHYLQDTPALFENAYPMYNPDKNPEYLNPTYPKSFEFSNYQDLSVELDQQVDEDSEVEESGA